MADKLNIAQMSYPAAAASGIVAKRAVVFDTSVRGNVKVPASTAEKTFAGITLENVSPANNVAVQLEGIAIVESDGSAVINPGDWLVVVGNATAAISGRVKSQALTAITTVTPGAGDLTYEVIGKCVDSGQIAATAGALVSVLLGNFLALGA